MLQRLAHRGPDDLGVEIYKNAALGHRRLSIIDLSAAGHQPMRHDHLEIVLNGEIYNYKELRSELTALGRRFISDSDTEVLLQAFHEWGEQAIERFVGMWAFLLLDRRNDHLLACRDPFGIKPLYRTMRAGTWLLASDVTALLPENASPRANAQRVADYLVLGVTDHGAATFFAGIEQLEPGTLWRLDLASGRTSERAYYDLAGRTAGRLSTPEQFAQALRRSVSLHLRSDVPVGTCLSGGLDSSTVAALAAQAHDQTNGRFGAVTARSEAADTDETSFAGLVARHCNLAWHIAAPTYEDFARDIETCLAAQGEPVVGPSVFMQYHVFRTAKQHGFKVMLDGQGGDEALLGYERYFVAYLLDLLRRGEVARALTAYRQLARNSGLGLGRLLQYLLYFGIPAVRRWRTRRRASFLVPQALSATDETLATMSKAFGRIRCMQQLELSRYCLPHLLRYEDRNSMAWSIEARVPFVTTEVMETALTLPPEGKIRDGFSKHPIRLLAAQLLPPEIAWRRRKFGFEAPSSLWLRQRAPEIEREIGRSAIISAMAQRRVQPAQLGPDLRWRLYNLAVWERQFNVSLG